MGVEIYARHLAPPTPALGDPLNDTGTLAIRVVSLGAVMIAAYDCLSDIDDSKGWVLDDDNKWIVEVLCAGVLAALIYSQLKLFQGIWADFFSDYDEEGEAELEETISLMLKADAVRMVIFLEEKLDMEGLHIKEVRAATVRSGATS